MNDFAAGGGRPGIDGPYTPIFKLFEAAANAVNTAPMLAVLFVATRMRAIQLTQGETDKYEMPPDYAKRGMYLSTAALFLQLLMVLLLPSLAGGGVYDVDSDGLPE